MKLKYLIILFIIIFFINNDVIASDSSTKDSVTIKIIETTDIHGAIFPYNIIKDKPANTSLAQVYTLIKEERSKKNQYVILLDAGDILQGQPVVYYYNYEKTNGLHIVSEIFNFMRYDAAAIGNHDIETGHAVYDKIVKEFKFPWLSANTLIEGQDKPYFKPYTIIKRGKLKIAILGMITPSVPNKFYKNLWEGMKFDDIVVSSKKWMKIIQQYEKPDIIIGLFHSGVDYEHGGAKIDTPFNDNASEVVAERVPGFDMIFVGHDHKGWVKKIKNINGDTVWIFGGKDNCKSVPLVTLKLDYDINKKIWNKDIEGNLVSIKAIKADKEFIRRFDKQFNEVKKFIEQPLGKISARITAQDSMFGDGPFVDFIHKIQLLLTEKSDSDLNKADISFASPQDYDAIIPYSKDGSIHVRDIFKIYTSENYLYTIKLTGRQIKDYLEYSYSNWFNLMKDENDHLMNFEKDHAGNYIKNKKGKLILKGKCSNFDSAAGIIYTVDVSKPRGERITIKSMADGKPFILTKIYSVVINSSRALGKSGHLEYGAGLSISDIRNMKYVTSATLKDIKFYIMNWIKDQKKIITPGINGNWNVVPEDYWIRGRALDNPILFKDKNEK